MAKTVTSGELLAGISLGPGQIRAYPERVDRKGHTMGVAAHETEDGTRVTLYTDLDGQRAAEATFGAEEWNGHMDDLRATGDNRATALGILSRITEAAFGHVPFDRFATVDSTLPASEQIQPRRPGNARVETSIGSVEALIVAAQLGELASATLVKQTSSVPVEDYNALPQDAMPVPAVPANSGILAAA